MLNRNSSAGTAAQKCSKSSLLQRPAIILAMLLLCAVFVRGQASLINPIGIINTDTTTSIDTVKVILLVSDTATNFYTTKNYKKIIQRCEGCMYDYAIDTTKYVNNAPKIIIAYSVRRKECCINGNTSNLAYYQPIPYYTHLLYLDEENQPLKATVIVWQSVSAK